MITQYQMVMRHLETNGSITSMEAFDKYGITRLSAVVFTLKERGAPIERVLEEGLNRYGEKSQYARYYLRGDNSGRTPDVC